jgi:hypothetical protein
VTLEFFGVRRYSAAFVSLLADKRPADQNQSNTKAKAAEKRRTPN